MPVNESMPSRRIGTADAIDSKKLKVAATTMGPRHAAGNQRAPMMASASRINPAAPSSSGLPPATSSGRCQNPWPAARRGTSSSDVVPLGNDADDARVGPAAITTTPGMSHIAEANSNAPVCRTKCRRPSRVRNRPASTRPATMPPNDPAMQRATHARKVADHFERAFIKVGSTQGNTAAATHIA